MSKMSILEVKGLKKYFPQVRGIFRRTKGEVKAVDGVSFAIDKGETVGLVGESGSGKSTVGRLAIRLIEPTAGEVHFQGKDLLALPKKELLTIRQQAQMIFQDPLASLNPRKTVLENIGEALLYHHLIASKEEQIARVLAILQEIGLPAHALLRYPHQFSGGQQQRIAIGRAIAMRPSLIICDEAVSALDLSIQAQILNLLYDLKQKHRLSYLFISHDLSVVRSFSDRVLVMFQGRIVESGPVEDVFDNPKHPYTRLLLLSIPSVAPKQQKEKRALLSRSAPSCNKGCPFFARCPVSKPTCQEDPPPLKIMGAHSYSCIH